MYCGYHLVSSPGTSRNSRSENFTPGGIGNAWVECRGRVSPGGGGDGGRGGVRGGGLRGVAERRRREGGTSLEGLYCILTPKYPSP